MIEFDKVTTDFQKFSKDGYEAVQRSYGEMNKGFQEISTHFTDYSKQAFADATKNFETLASAKSLEDAVEIQTKYAKSAYENWMAEMTKLTEMYVAVTRDAYKPVEKAVEKTTSAVSM